MPKIEFFHQMNPKAKQYTVAVQLDLTKDNLIAALEAGNVVNLNIGHSKLNPKDKNFSRKIGREVAVEKMTEEVLLVKGIETLYNYESATEYSISNIYLANGKYLIALRAYSGSDNLRLFYCELK